MRFRCISPKTLLLRLSLSAFSGPQPLSQVLSVHVSRSFTSSSSSGSAGSSFSSGYSSSRCFQQTEESGNVGVYVWWDLDCKLPAGTNGLKVVQGISNAIRSSGIEGPINLTAFGDVTELLVDIRKAVSSTGIIFKHDPLYEEPTSEMAIILGLTSWTLLNKPPAHIFVITNNENLSNILHKVRMRLYNVLLASNPHAPGVLRSAATIMWDWPALVTGENPTARHYNQPPDHLWYGYYRNPLEDPFAAFEQSNCEKTGESLASNSNLNFKESTALSKIPLRLDSGCGLSTPSGRRVGENGTDKSESPGFFDRILNWFKCREKDATAAKHGGEPRGTWELGSDSYQVNEISSEESLWREIESFIFSPRGFTISSHSKTREEMARNLQKEGPSCLKPLTELDMLRLVDALISEKKWVEESPCETLPFRVTRVEKSSDPGHSRTVYCKTSVE